MVTRNVASKQELVDELIAEHAALKQRVQKLERHLSLSPEEQIEIAKLKKMKLRTKERLYQLQQS